MTPNASKNTLEFPQGHASNYYIINSKIKIFSWPLNYLEHNYNEIKAHLHNRKFVSITRSYASVHPPFIKEIAHIKK